MWIKYWSNRKFKFLFVSGCLLIAAILILYSVFLNWIEQRQGIVLNDFVLNFIPAKDFSALIFGLVWLSTLLTLIYFYKNPKQFLQFLWGYIFLFVTRFLTIYFVKLNPPQNIIPLVDPITNAFYGGVFLTKDLFYSGHTATIFLMYFVVDKKWLKKILLVASVCVGILVLVQHVHYTIDVLAAPVFAYIIFLIGKKIATIKINGDIEL